MPFQMLVSGKHNAPECSTEDLMKEYLFMMKAGFDRVFGRNARVAQAVIGKELISRGMTEIPNIFGAIQISTENSY